MKKNWLWIGCALWSMVSWGAEVAIEDAEAAVRGWKRDAGNTLEEDFAGKEVLRTSAFEDEAGRVIFYAVEFVGGGYVVTAAQDALEPIIAFSDTGMLVQDERNPLWAMLNAEMRVRTQAAVDNAPAAGGGFRAQAEDEGLAQNRARWGKLIAAGKGGGISAQGLSSVSDVRVSPLVQSKWDQEDGIYNYYTPNNYVCGCVATAMAQLMRFHRYPTGYVSDYTRECFVNGSPRNLTMKGGNYDWDNMPLNPGSYATTTQKQAIGKLTYDCGVSVYMDYGYDGSGAHGSMASLAFEDVFGYSNARGISVNGNISSAARERAILANLDAGCPVLLGIDSSYAGGHEVVGDGYGYSGSTCYVHLNLGWSGSSDAWYNLPTVDAGLYSFSSVHGIVYNVFPNRTGELITGRVTDSNGNPLSGVTVTAGASSTTTNGRGIYALYVNGGYTYTVTASNGSSSKSLSVSVSVSENTYYVPPRSYYSNTGTIGNSWGNNFVLSQAAPPSTPSGVSATDGTSTANVGISWSGVSGATEYEVYRAGSSSGSKELIGTTSGTSTTDGSATPGVVYYYWVKATNAAGSSGYSSSDSGYRKLSAPTVTASTTDGAKVTVTCTAVTGATHYRLSRATSSGGTKTVIGGWQTGRSWEDTSATVGTTYYYFVEAAVSSSGTRPSAYSSAAQGRRPLLPPSAPGSVSATDGTSTENVGISWGAVNNATGYDVYRAGTSGGTKSRLKTVSSTSTTDTSATPGVVYTYWVKATNAGGESEFSGSNTGYRKLSAPTVSASTTESARVAVSCGAVTGATHYRLSRAATSSGAKTVLGGWQIERTWEDTTAAYDTTYYYFVEAAVSSSGTRPSAYSSAAQGMRPEPPPPPATPMGLSATDGTTTANVGLSWSAVSDAASYEVYRAESASGSKVLLKTVTGTSTTDTSATPGVVYTYWVKATNEGGASDFSDADSGYRKLSAPAVTATTTDTAKVGVSCGAVTGATHYRLSRAATSSGVKTVLGGWQTERTWEDTTAPEGETQYYFVQAAMSPSGVRPSDFSAGTQGMRKAVDPKAPKNVVATDGTTTNNVVITWSSVSGATGYDVYRSTSITGSKTRIKAGVTSPTLTDTTASAGTLYYYWVKANLASGSSEFSSYDTGFKKLGVTTVTASSIHKDKVTVSCTVVTGASYYRLARALSANGAKTVLGDWQTSRTWEDTTGQTDVTYDYFVQAAVNAEGMRPGDYSVGAQGMRPSENGPSIPDPPVNVQAEDGTSSAGVTVTWTVASGAASYDVYRSTSEGGSKTRIKTGVEETTTFDTTASAGTLYYYWVKSVNDLGTSGFSEFDTGYKGLEAATVTASVSDTTKITVSCTVAKGASYYRLSRATSVGGTKTVIGTWQTARTWTDSAVAVDTTYYYFVEAATSATGLRSSGYSEAGEGRRPSVAPPSAPTGFNATDGTSTASVDLSWTAASTATSYEVYRAETSSGEKELLDTVMGTSATDFSAMPGVVYYYWVKAKNKGGTSGFSGSNSGYRKLSAPIVTASTTDLTKVVISCGTVTGATHYKFFRATSATGSKSALSGWQEEQVYEDATAAEDTTYYYFVQAAVSSSGLRPSAHSEATEGRRPSEEVIIPPHIDAMTISQDSRTMSLSFGVESGKTYRVQRTDSLSPVAWTTIDTITPTTSGTQTRSYTLPTNKDAGFYRVVLVQ